MPLDDLTAELSRRHPQHATLISVFRDRWRETLGPVIQESVAALAELTEAGVRCFALSNWGADTFALVEDELDFLRHFDGIVISGREGVVKPDPAIFELLCVRHAIRPDAALFIDDSVRNVTTAAGLGFDTVHYTDRTDVRAELLDRGLLPR